MIDRADFHEFCNALGSPIAVISRNFQQKSSDKKQNCSIFSSLGKYLFLFMDRIFIVFWYTVKSAVIN